MPTTPPPYPQSPNVSSAAQKPDEILEIAGKRYWTEQFLQQTYDNEFSVIGPIVTVGPNNYTSTGPTTLGGEPLPPGRYCMKHHEEKKYRQEMGVFYYVSYEIEEETSGLEILGWVLVGVAVVGATVITAGAFAGAATFVVAAGSSAAAAGATVGSLTAVSVAGYKGATALGAAGGIMIGAAKDNEVKGAKISGGEGYITKPLGEAVNYHNEWIVDEDWKLC